MDIYDEGLKRIEGYDPEAGGLTPASVVVTLSWEVESEEAGHWETVAEYPETGGKEVAWVVDEPERGRWRATLADGTAFDYPGTVPDDWPREQEVAIDFPYLLYTPYTEEELAARAEAEADAELQERISELQRKLDETDYVVVKMTEYSLTDAELPEDDAERYASIIEQREAWRSEAHDLLATRAERLAARAG